MIGILSDAHGNDAAFNKAVRVLRAFGAQSFFFLGDAVGYIPSIAVLESLKDMPNTSCIRGNHEEMLMGGSCEAERADIYKILETRNMMSSDNLDFIAGWPASRRKDFAAGRALFVHGSPTDPTHGYVYPDTDLEPFKDVEADFIFMGHTHRPFIRTAHGKQFINVGSCGMPRDIGRLGAAALFDEESGVTRILRFDIDRETKETLGGVGAVHPSVLQLFERAEPHGFGEHVEL